MGDLKIVEPEVLGVGDTRPIVAGKEFIHALFHLERPSVTIVVRNRKSGLPFHQYKYRKPGLGFDGLYRDDLWTAFQVTDRWFNKIGLKGLDSLIETLTARDSSIGEIAPSLFGELGRSNRVLRSRGKLTDPRHRIFLALMVNLPPSNSVGRIVDQLFPGEDPSALIKQWVHELASPEFMKITGLSIEEVEMAAFDTLLQAGSTDKALELVSTHWMPAGTRNPAQTS